jgi:hypothetical protein
MNSANTFESENDVSFPYVLVSSLMATLVSLTAVWTWAATTLGPLTGA